MTAIKTIGNLEDWRARGSFLEVHGLRIFTTSTGSRNAPTLVCLHGFPSSSADFHQVLPLLTRKLRVVTHDHPGFGLSDKPDDYSYSLIDQADIALGVWKTLGIREAHLLAHDYGTSVATEILCRRQRAGIALKLKSVTLSNGSVFLDMARLRLSQRILRNPHIGRMYARLAGKNFFHRRMRGLFARPDSVSESDLDIMWDAINQYDGRKRLADISYYLFEREKFRDRWTSVLPQINIPAHILWGRRDPVAVPAIGQRLADEIPGARLTWLNHCGHYPMLEDPSEYAEAALDFLEGLVKRKRRGIKKAGKAIRKSANKKKTKRSKA
ncbi:MAG: alpha/beta hydrolase [Leptospiraceae bacterium]|nr:alpha/beta hydrolase [Leptospiraceae bacterium]